MTPVRLSLERDRTVTPEICSLALQVWGLLVTAIIGLKTGNRKVSIVSGVILMAVVNFVAQTIIAGEGAAGCLGFILLPCWGAVVASLAATISKKLWEPRGSDVGTKANNDSEVKSSSAPSNQSVHSGPSSDPL
jgi:uncharacterized membrane protein YeaQ/YmgE (transglycosylase-associated protein family)